MSFANPNNETREDIRDRLLRVLATELFNLGFAGGVPKRLREAIDRGTVDCVRVGLRARLKRDSDSEITNPYGTDFDPERDER